MNRVTLISLGALLGLGALTTTLVACEQKEPAVPDPAVAVETEHEATAAPGPDDADDPCAKWIAQGVNCEYIAFEAMEIRPQMEADQALATTEL